MRKTNERPIKLMSNTKCSFDGNDTHSPTAIPSQTNLKQPNIIIYKMNTEIRHTLRLRIQMVNIGTLCSARVQMRMRSRVRTRKSGV